MKQKFIFLPMQTTMTALSLPLMFPRLGRACSFSPHWPLPSAEPARRRRTLHCPPIRNRRPNKGILRVFGAGLHGLLHEWEEGYMKQNPDVKIADNPGGSDAAIGVLQHGTAEIAVFGREMELNDYLGFYENHGYNPTEITIASGTYDVPGASWAR